MYILHISYLSLVYLYCSVFFVIREVSQRCNKFSASQLAHIVWAYGALSLRHTELCDAVVKSCQLEMSSFNANALASICWGFAMVEHRSVGFMHEAARHIMGGIETLKPLQLWRCASAFNSLMVHSKEIKESILQEALQKHEEFSLTLEMRLKSVWRSMLFLAFPIFVEGFPFVSKGFKWRSAAKCSFLLDVWCLRKGLSRLLDCYVMCHPSAAHESLMKLLEERLEEVAQQLKQLYRGPEADPQVLDFLTKCGFLELQVEGMKRIFQLLDMGTPSWAFLSKAMKEAASYVRCQAFVVAELSMEGSKPLLVTRAYEKEELATGVFVADSFGASTADAQVLHFVLEVVAQKLSEASEGLLQLLLLRAVSGNSVALLLQFQSRFPQVKLRFTELFVESAHMRRPGPRR